MRLIGKVGLILVLLVGAPASAQAASAASRIRFAAAGDLLLPVNDGFGEPGLGFGVSTGVWLERGDAVIHPRLAFHYGLGSASSQFIDLMADAGAAWLFPVRPVTPILGGGVGFRFLSVRGPTQVSSIGSVLQLTSRSATYGAAVGFGGYLRAGFVFFRDSGVSITALADLTAGVLGELGYPVGALFSLGMLL